MSSELQTALRDGDTLARQGNLAAAEVQFARARTLAPRDLHAALGLGHVLRLLHRPGEARAVFAEAIAIMPELADAHHGMGLACQELADLGAAEAAYRVVLALVPTSLDGALGLADVLNILSRPEETLVLLAPFSSADAQVGAALEQMRGAAHFATGRFQSALLFFDLALSLDAGNRRAGHSRAVALDRLGREDAALVAYRRVVVDNPANLDAHEGLNLLLLHMGRDAEFLRSYDEAERRLPGVPEFAIARGDLLARQGRRDAAVPHYARGLAMTPDSQISAFDKAAALVALGQIGAAVDLYEVTLKTAPDDVRLLTALATAHLMARDAGRAETAAARAVLCAPTDQVALAALGGAWRMQGDDREHELNRYERFVQVIDLAPPVGYSDMDSFNGDLDHWLDGQHANAGEPLHQSLRGGTQTQGDLFGDGNALVQALRARINEAVAAFVEALPRDAGHPFLGRRGDGFSFGGWSSRLSDSGFHANHLHPDGWISSAYYVALPEIAADTDKKEGWLQFGAPSYDAGFLHPVRRTVQPRVGRLVLFPSYLWHGTSPFHAPRDRTTIAFDVVPIRPH